MADSISVGGLISDLREGRMAPKSAVSNERGKEFFFLSDLLHQRVGDAIVGDPTEKRNVLPTMRIGIILRYLNQHKGGVLRYTDNLLREMLRLDTLPTISGALPHTSSRSFSSFWKAMEIQWL
jgi:hypothetical protein